MGIIGCGIMFTSLILGAMSGSVSFMIEIMVIGTIPIIIEIILVKTREKKMKQWQKTFPPYGY